MASVCIHTHNGTSPPHSICHHVCVCVCACVRAWVGGCICGTMSGCMDCRRTHDENAFIVILSGLSCWRCVEAKASSWCRLRHRSRDEGRASAAVRPGRLGRRQRRLPGDGATRPDRHLVETAALYPLQRRPVCTGVPPLWRRLVPVDTQSAGRRRVHSGPSASSGQPHRPGSHLHQRQHSAHPAAEI